MRVAVAARDDRRLADDHSADDVHDRERMKVAVRIDTDDVVQLICKHPRTDLQPKRWGTHPVSVWGRDRRRQNCDGSRARDADRLPIRPASGRQAGTGLFARTHHWKDTAYAGHSRIGSRIKSTDTNLTSAPDETARRLTVRECRLIVTTASPPAVTNRGNVSYRRHEELGAMLRQ
jgi:hypothetical protein